MVQGLSLGLVLPLVQLAGQRLGLPNHHYFFSALILLARLAQSFNIVSSPVLWWPGSSQRERRGGEEESDRKFRSETSFSISLCKTEILRKPTQTSKMNIDMKKKRKRRRRKKKNFLMLMTTFFPHLLYTPSKGGCKNEGLKWKHHRRWRSVTYGDLVEGQRPNLACISEEAMEVQAPCSSHSLMPRISTSLKSFLRSLSVLRTSPLVTRWLFC